MKMLRRLVALRPEEVSLDWRLVLEEDEEDVLEEEELLMTGVFLMKVWLRSDLDKDEEWAQDLILVTELAGKRGKDKKL